MTSVPLVSFFYSHQNLENGKIKLHTFQLCVGTLSTSKLKLHSYFFIFTIKITF